MTGKFHFTRWGIICLAVVVALATIGVTYAGWSGKPMKTDKVVFVDSFTWAVSNDDGNEDTVSPYGIIDPGDYPSGLDPCQPQTMGEELPEEDRYDKNVASTEAIWSATTPLEIDITVNNAYPCYHSTVFFGMTGCENVPAQIVAIIIDEDATTPDVIDDIDALTVTYSEIYEGQPIPAGEEVTGALHVHVEQEALQDHTYTISVTIGVDCEAKCGTAYAYGGDYATCFSEYGFKSWGWTNGPLTADFYEFPLYAGAGGCDISGGELVGTVTIAYNGSTATVTYTLDAGYTMDVTHLYVGTEPLPKNKKGNFTVSPGQYPYSHDLEDATSDSYTVSISGDYIYVVAHAVVCGLE